MIKWWTESSCNFCMVGIGAAFLLLVSLPNSAVAPPEILRPVLADEKVPLQPFQLVDHHRRPLGLDYFQGRWTFVVFGYTYCPDICPTNLLQLAAMKRVVREQHSDQPVPQLLFISVDPQRDTLESLAAYVHYFDPELRGVIGTEHELERLEQQLETFHRYGKPDANGRYTVDHGAEIFLIDPRGRLYARFPPPVVPRHLAEQYTAITTYFASQDS